MQQNRQADPCSSNPLCCFCWLAAPINQRTLLLPSFSVHDRRDEQRCLTSSLQTSTYIHSALQTLCSPFSPSHFPCPPAFVAPAASVYSPIKTFPQRRLQFASVSQYAAGKEALLHSTSTEIYLKASPCRCSALQVVNIGGYGSAAV